MSIFKTRYKTTVATTVSRGIPDNMIPDAVKIGALKGILSGEQLVENILEEINASIGIKAERMYRYAKASYVHGLPSSSIHFSNAGEAAVREVLTALEGQPVTIKYSKYGPLNSLHYGWMAIIEQYGYNPQTNELTVLSAIKKYPVYLADMVVNVAEATVVELENGSLDQWGTAPSAGYTPKTPMFSGGSELSKPIRSTPYAVDLSASVDYLRVDYVWNKDYIHEESLKIPITGLDVNKNYFQAKYVVGGITKYWRYQDDLGTHPTLDALFSTTQDSLGKFFPFVYFRHKKKSVAKDPNSVEYKSSTKLMKYLGMNYGDLAESINQNPDIDDVEQALFMMGVPADTTNEVEQRYLFDFFNRAYVESGGMVRSSSVKIAGLFSATSTTGRGAETSIVIEDARSKMTLGMTGLYRHKKVGVIAPVGRHSSECVVQKVTNTAIAYVDGFDTVGSPYTWESKVPCHYYRKQLTAGIYEELQVYDLNMSYRVWKDYETTSDEDKKILLVPVDHSITENYSASDREELYARSFHYVFNSRVVTKIKWYQGAFFKFVLIVVAVAITIVTWGTDGGYTLGAALAAGDYLYIAMTVLAFIVKSAIEAAVIKLFVKLAGVEAVLVVAIILAMYGIYSSFDTAPAAGTATTSSAVKGAPWSNQLLKISSGLIKEVGSYYTEALQGLQDEYTDFLGQAKKQDEALQTAANLLKDTSILSPFVIFGESPDDFFNRTCHAGNIGIVAIDAIHNYVDIALTLPKLDTTVGDTFSV